MSALKLLIGVQTFSFLLAGIIFIADGNTKLGGAQLLLAVVNGLVYL